jgi:hypothetical protein
MSASTQSDRRCASYWLTASKQELRRAYAKQAAEEARYAEEFKNLDRAWLNGLIGDASRLI